MGKNLRLPVGVSVFVLKFASFPVHTKIRPNVRELQAKILTLA